VIFLEDHLVVELVVVSAAASVVASAVVSVVALAVVSAVVLAVVSVVEQLVELLAQRLVELLVDQQVQQPRQLLRRPVVLPVVGTEAASISHHGQSLAAMQLRSTDRGL
jgi:hypothetical protein